MAATGTPLATLRPAPIHRLTSPLRRFLHIEAASGFVLLACAAVAMILANTPLGEAVHHFWSMTITVGIGSAVLAKPLEWWVNDGLMTIFFFVVGLEIKRELITGELRTLKRATLPVIGAIGGMIAPALIYLSFGHDAAAHRGWGVPMATDIAFVVGVMALFGNRVPFGLKIFLLSLAIADDMGAVLVIAIAYTPNLDLVMLGLSGLGFATVVGLNWLGVRPVSIYVLVGVAAWLAMYKSGVHPTIAGVLLGLLTPWRPWIARDSLQLVLTDVSGKIAEHPDKVELHPADVELLRFAAREAVAPLQRLEDGLHPWVGFLIMPVFALANAGVVIDPAAVVHPVSLAVTLALFLGKFVGIFGLSYLAVKVGLATLPTAVTWRQMAAAAILGGIGFTMSIFVADLAFKEDHHLLECAKTGILLGSGLSAVVGALLLRASLPKESVSPGT